MRVEDIGEFDLIDALIGVIERRGLDPAGPEGRLLRIGAGDDAAAWERPAGVDMLTNDVMVEGVHFDLAAIGWRELGWKCAAVNLSDVAAMGCLPGFAVVGLGLPGELRVADLVEMYEGMLDVCERYGCALVGGDVVSSPTFFVSVAVTGMAQTDGDGTRPLLARDGARVGDLVALTGHVGCSGGGLRMMTEGRELDAETAAHLRLAHVRPAPRLSEGAALARHGAHAAIDVSDGLLDDLGKLCRASGVGAVVRLDRLPADDHLRTAYPREWPSLALGGGEDYELLTAATADTLERVGSEGGAPISVIGEIVPEDAGVRVVDERGEPVTVDTGGWDHFRNPPPPSFPRTRESSPGMVRHHDPGSSPSHRPSRPGGESGTSGPIDR